MSLVNNIRRARRETQPGYEFALRLLLEGLSNDLGTVRFVQIGSNDGKSDDPLYELIKRYDWRGTMVEPLPHIFNRLQQTHANSTNVNMIRAAVSDKDGFQPFYHIAPEDTPDELEGKFDKLGSFDPQHIAKHKIAFPELSGRKVTSTNIECMTFETLANKAEIDELDLLHIDAEGHDISILRSVNLVKFEPKIIIFEHRHCSYAEWNAMERHLRLLGYQCHAGEGDTICILGGKWLNWATHTGLALLWFKRHARARTKWYKRQH